MVLSATQKNQMRDRDRDIPTKVHQVERGDGEKYLRVELDMKCSTSHPCSYQILNFSTIDLKDEQREIEREICSGQAITSCSCRCF